ncbi:zinc finger protein [Theobroma cacao]|nr:zinc finger protein [Theobroma cacao]
MMAFCYECGGIGHVKRDCPTYRHNQEMARGSIRSYFATAPTRNVKRDKGKGVTSSSQGRSTRSTQQVVTSNLFICGYEASVLFDPGSTHSFVSSNFMPKLGKHYEYMDEQLVVTTPLKESYVAKYVFRSCVVQIKDRDTWVDFVLMTTLGFDVILGMDWLASCYANVDCYCKLVKFKFPREPSFVIYGHNRHLVESVMAIITKEVQNEKENLVATPVVNEFVDVFQEELPGLPFKREIKFHIDLIPETQPISMPPYQMAPAELNELRE